LKLVVPTFQSSLKLDAISRQFELKCSNFICLCKPFPDLAYSFRIWLKETLNTPVTKIPFFMSQVLAEKTERVNCHSTMGWM
jgi:hypothetical protein